jgi:hypothetical protein
MTRWRRGQDFSWILFGPPDVDAQYEVPVLSYDVKTRFSSALGRNSRSETWQ